MNRNSADALRTATLGAMPERAFFTPAYAAALAVMANVHIPDGEDRPGVGLCVIDETDRPLAVLRLAPGRAAGDLAGGTTLRLTLLGGKAVMAPTARLLFAWGFGTGALASLLGLIESDVVNLIFGAKA